MTAYYRSPINDDAVSGDWSGTVGSRYGAGSLLHGTTAGDLTFGFDGPLVPAGSTVDFVVVEYYDYKTDAAVAAIGGRLKVAGSYYNSSTHNPANGVSTLRSHTWATNPATAAAWTVDEVNGIGGNALEAAGYRSTDADPTIVVSGIRIYIEFTAPGSPYLTGICAGVATHSAALKGEAALDPYWIHGESTATGSLGPLNALAGTSAGTSSTAGTTTATGALGGTSAGVGWAGGIPTPSQTLPAWLGSGFDCSCPCVMSLDLVWGEYPATTNPPPDTTTCLFWARYSLTQDCELVDSNEEGFSRPPTAPDMVATLEGSTLGVIYSGPAYLLPIEWPAKNSETYTLTVEQSGSTYTDINCPSKTKTLVIAADACPCPDVCLFGPDTWTLILSGAGNGRNVHVIAGGGFYNAGNITTLVDATALNHSKTVPLFLVEYVPFASTCWKIQCTAEAYLIGRVTSTVTTTILGGLVTSSSSFDVYAKIGPSFTGWPPSPSFQPQDPQVTFVAKVISFNIGSRVFRGTPYYLSPWYFFTEPFTTPLPPSDITGNELLLYPSRALNGTCTPASTGGVLATRYLPSYCECLCPGQLYGEYGWSGNSNGFNSLIPSGEVALGGGNIAFATGTLLRSIWNGVTNGYVNPDHPC